MDRFKDKVIIVDDEIAIRQKLFHKILFLTLITCSACIVMAIIAQVKILELLLYTVVWFSTLFLYLNSLKNTPHFTEILFFIALLTIVNSALYAITKGQEGPANQVYTVIALMAIVLFQPKYKFIVAGFYLFLQIYLRMLELTFPSFVLNKNEAYEISLFEEFFQYVLYGAFIVITICIKSAYVRQQRIIQEDTVLLENLLFRFKKMQNIDQIFPEISQMKNVNLQSPIMGFNLPSESVDQIECMGRQELRSFVCRIQGLNHLLQITDREDAEGFRNIIEHYQLTCLYMEKAIDGKS